MFVALCWPPPERASAATVEEMFQTILTYVKAQGFTAEQVKSRTPSQWKTHAIAAGIQDLRAFARAQNSLKHRARQYLERRAVVNKVNTFLTTVRTQYTDEQLVEIMTVLMAEREDWYNDPNGL